MNGSIITTSVTPTMGGNTTQPDWSWFNEAIPKNFG